MQFNELGLARPIMQALANEGHATPTPIQAGAISPIMDGKDFLGVAQTGTGKTAAFALPILHRLADKPHENRRGDCRVVVLTPTRELAAQVLERFQAYGKFLRLRTGLVIGGASIGKQKAMARNGLDIVVATPGRLVDLMNQKAIDLSRVETFVLDEVDQMLDLGFIPAIRTICNAIPEKRQSIFLSATMPPAIAKLASNLLRNPVRIEIAASKPLKIDQSVMFIEKSGKSAALLKVIQRDQFTRGLIFTRTKHGADKVTKTLNDSGAKAFAIHGSRSQAQRERALDAFRSGKVKVLVATDIAARGIDVTGVSHVVNFDLPNVPETYVHRIGRTARAGAAGAAISFCSGEERPFLRSIEKLTQQKIAVVANDGSPAARPYCPESDRPFRENAGSGKPGARRNGRPSGKFGQKPVQKAGQKAKSGAKNHAGQKSYRKNPSEMPSFVTKQPANEYTAQGEKKGQEDGERGITRVRRRRNRGSAGRQFSRHAG